MSVKLIIAIISAIATGILTSCGGNTDKGASVTDTDSLPQAVVCTINYIGDSDSTSFARIVRYPLERPYPLPNIENASQMQAYYATLVDDSLRRVIATGKWTEYGWRGWSINDGEYIWLDGDSIYDIPYTSAAEQIERAHLTEAEIASLHPSLKGGWQPVICYMSDSHLMRIDCSPKEVYRLAVYSPDALPGDLPEQVLYGNIDREGTMLGATYTFPLPADGAIVIENSPADSDTPVLTAPDGLRAPLHAIRWLSRLPN